MMKEQGYQSLMGKLQELRALFTLGQRLIPFIEELFEFIGDISSTLNEMGSAIEENISRMPKASKQISKVTQATELATTEIMDIVDGMSYKFNIISNNLQEVQTRYYALQHACSAISEIARAGLSNGQMGNPYLTKIETILQEQTQNEDSTDIFKNSESVFASVRDDSNNIMMSLQVQDITTQQLAAVSNMIETVQSKLRVVLGRFDTLSKNPEQIEVSFASKRDVVNHIRNQTHEQSLEPNTNSVQLHRTVVFDPNAINNMSSTNRGDMQADVDSLISSFESGEHLMDNADSDDSEIDIDAMFATTSSVNSTEPPQTITLTESVDDDGEIDIDAMFAGVNPPSQTEENTQTESNPAIEIPGDPFDEVSQNDIDALFR
jgi:chemotaxis regulatin CheY-phosphate phosphatase CheZ